ncbi:arp2 3 complex subunit [Stagonosporopsis vannaccii]|nr:arp2 3 complex subunit [Stagonosporopsis vannaccii]
MYNITIIRILTLLAFDCLRLNPLPWSRCSRTCDAINARHRNIDKSPDPPAASTPSQEGGALHPTTWRPSCDLTSSSPAHSETPFTATCTHTSALTYSAEALCTTASMANINWRTINIDALDPDSPANFDLSSLTPAVEPVSTADVQNTAQQIRQLLRGGDNEGALQGALEAPPYGADDKGKEAYLAIVLEVLQSIRQAEIAQMLSRIYSAPGGSEALDVLMKYIYKGMAQAAPASNARNVTPQATGFSQVHSRGGGEGGGQAMSVLLSWHEKLVEVAGPGSIVRVMTDRRTV